MQSPAGTYRENSRFKAMRVFALLFALVCVLLSAAPAQANTALPPGHKPIKYTRWAYPSQVTYGPGHPGHLAGARLHDVPFGPDGRDRPRQRLDHLLRTHVAYLGRQGPVRLSGPGHRHLRHDRHRHRPAPALRRVSHEWGRPRRSIRLEWLIPPSVDP